MLGEKIRELRKKRYITCSQLARRTGRSVATIHGIESGVNKNPSFYTVRDIARELQADLNELGKD